MHVVCQPLIITQIFVLTLRSQTASCSRFIAAKSYSTTQKLITAPQRYGYPTRSQRWQDFKHVSVSGYDRALAFLIFVSSANISRNTSNDPKKRWKR